MARNDNVDGESLYSLILPIVAFAMVVVCVLALANRFLEPFAFHLVCTAILVIVIFGWIIKLIKAGWNPFQ